jgi:hypothetical protein
MFWFENIYMDTTLGNKGFFNLVIWDGIEFVYICTTDPKKYIPNYSFTSELYFVNNLESIKDSAIKNNDIVKDFVCNEFIIEDINNYINDRGYLKPEFRNNRNVISAFIFKGFLVFYKNSIDQIVISK